MGNIFAKENITGVPSTMIVGSGGLIVEAPSRIAPRAPLQAIACQIWVEGRFDAEGSEVGGPDCSQMQPIDELVRTGRAFQESRLNRFARAERNKNVGHMVAFIADVTVVNSTTITAIAPAHVAGPADVVVTNPDGSGGTLTAAFTYSFEEPFTVTPSTDAVDAGARISVSWTAPGARAGDCLAVFRVGASYDDDWWDDTNGATSGTRTLSAPTRPGQYEFRNLLEGSFVDARAAAQ